MYILAAIAVAIGTLICLANWSVLVMSGRRHVSVAPLVGAGFLFVGLRGFPVTESWAWLSPLADWGTLSLYNCAATALPAGAGNVTAESTAQLS